MHTEPGHGHWPRLRRSLWATTFFLLGFTALIALVAVYYLVPATDAARAADSAGRRQISAFSMLLMSVILFVLLVGLAMTFRVHRFFFPRPVPKRTSTEYVDAWTESGRRMSESPDADDLAEDDDDDEADEHGTERV
jgi:hypothetical protein